MNKAIRFTLTLAAFGAAVASQAVTLSVDYVGKGDNGGPSTSVLGDFGDLNFVSSLTTGTAAAPTAITLDNGAGGQLVITLGADQDADPLRYSGSATATGTGTLTGVNSAAGAFSVVTNNLKSYVVSIQGDVQAVPEPASMAALGVGAVALLRRRNKKA